MRTGEAQKLYTPETLSIRWQCSAATIRSLIRRGDLLAFRLGRWLRIPVDAVEAFERHRMSVHKALLRALP
jgi:excisionase family DNA binding protein